jgi:DNA-binding MarR family transcriptional regulator
MSITPSTPDADLAVPATASARAQEVVLALAAIGHDITGAIEELTGRADLTGNVPGLILCGLSLRGPLRPRDLMEVTHLTSGGLTKQLDHLEAEGLIKRRFGTLRDDRRASIVSLTTSGQRAATQIGEAVESRFVELRGVLSRIETLLGE